jgi:hypothetical protein
MVTLLIARSFLVFALPLALVGCAPQEAPPFMADEVVMGLRGQQPDVVIHSTLADTNGLAADLRIIERKLGPLAPASRDHLAAIEVQYFSFTDSTCTAVNKKHLCSGILLVHACVAADIQALFAAFRADTFPIAKVIPINRYGLSADSTGWNDQASMADNNTSAFNYRRKPTTGHPSKHAQGIAIDINPLLNPMVHNTVSGRRVEPLRGRFDPRRPGTLPRQHSHVLCASRLELGRPLAQAARLPAPGKNAGEVCAHGLQFGMSAGRTVSVLCY